MEKKCNVIVFVPVYLMLILLVYCQVDNKRTSGSLLGLSPPVKVIHADYIMDGGTLGVKFMDIKGETLTVYLQLKPQKVNPNEIHCWKRR